MHLRWIAFVSSAMVLGWPTAAVAQASRPSELVKALREFDEQKRSAQDALLASFDAALSSIRPFTSMASSLLINKTCVCVLVASVF